MTDTPLRVLVHGASGRMGGTLLRLIAQAPDLRIVAAVSRQGVAGGAMALLSADLDAAPEFDVAIDFSLPDALEPLLALCETRARALVSGTTGLSPALRARLAAAGDRIPVLWAANFSLGVVVLEDLVERAARSLPGWRVELVETHHAGKLDIPSGTALVLARAAARGSGSAPAIESIREGEVVGDHRIELRGPGEILVLEHRAADRDIFATGALEAARLLARQGPGLHRFADLLGTDC